MPSRINKANYKTNSANKNINMILKKRNIKQTAHSHHVQKRWGCLIIFMASQPSSIQGPFGLNLLLLKLKTENTVVK